MDRPAGSAAPEVAGPHVPLPEVRAGDQHWFPALDGARALAAIGVLINHVGVLSGFNGRNLEWGPYVARADVGVSVFFVLSGFLLYRPFVVDRLQGVPMRDTSTYARRRLLRIFPAYWVALTIVAFVLHAPPFREPHSIVAHYLLLQVYDINQVVGGPIQQSWTLATEIGFYVFLPFFAWFLARRARDARRQVRAELFWVGMLWAASMAFQLVVLATGPTDERWGMVGTWFPARANEFALGMALGVLSAWWVHGRNRIPAWATTWAFTLGCWALALVAFWITATRLRLPPSPLLNPREALAMRGMYSVTSLLVVVPCVTAAARPGPARWVFANKVAVWLGLISYGIYLWHEAFQDLYLRWFDHEPLRAPALGMLWFTLVTSVVAGALSWYLVERPALRLGRGRGGRPPEVAERAPVASVVAAE
jgi:peptidoglycan/LPS O-acetylase OafA/YrhL